VDVNTGERLLSVNRGEVSSAVSADADVYERELAVLFMLDGESDVGVLVVQVM